MEIECENCYETTSIPRHRVGHSPLFCFSCGAKLRIKSPERDHAPVLRRERTHVYGDSFAHRSALTIDARPKSTRDPSSIRRRDICPYQDLCREYVWSLNWPRAYFDKRFNRCYCLQCYPASRRDTYQTAGETYVLPRDWVRFGLSVDSVKAKRENLWETWIVTYHGTKIVAARSILAHRQFLLPGDVCDDGTVIAIRPGHIPGKSQIYTSPTIKYSSLDCYCDRYKYSASDGKRYEVKIVLQCRQQPGTYKTQGETVGSGSIPLCNIIPNDKIEILTTVRAAVVPYGLLIRMKPI